MTSDKRGGIIPNPIEDRVARRQKRQRIQDIVLTGLYATTALGLAIAVPNTVQLLRYVQKYIGPHEKVDKRLYQALARLRAKGLVTKQNALTKSGRDRAAALDSIESVAPTVPLRWDGKWRIVMFDIWETRKAERDRLREVLLRMGFVKLQASVWIFPYPCEELFVYVRTQLRLGPAVKYMVVEEIDNDRALRIEFDLPKK